MQAKHCVSLLLWLAASVRGDDFEIPKPRETFAVHAQHFRKGGMVSLSCQRLAGPKIATELGHFACSQRDAFTCTKEEIYVASVKMIANKDGWIVHAKHVSFSDSNEDGWFLCKRARDFDFASTEGADYLGSVETSANKDDQFFFVCKRYRLPKFHQCRRDSYWSN